ncbi:MAG: type II toxin-antitoxin system VapC family toxin [Kiritimatiellia bacterium]
MDGKKSKPRVYVETTVISDATALPARDIVLAARQISTREWWSSAAERFELYSSDIVAREAKRGDAAAAQRRVAALRGIPELQSDQNAIALARELIARKAVPKEYPDDALHIATAALNGMDFLVSWNFKHITNGNTIPLVEKIVRENGYACPCICTPQMLCEGGRE